MKGIVFTEFLEMVEAKWGYEVVDKIINSSDLPSGGIYTAVGTYGHEEMVQLVTHLSEHSGISVPVLLQTYAKYFSIYMVQNYEHFFKESKDSFEFLCSLEGYIHVEVKKLYPDAEFPHFDTNRIDENTLEMIYTSVRKLPHFAFGLMESSIAYFKEDIDIEMENIEPDGSKVRFILTKK